MITQFLRKFLSFSLLLTFVLVASLIAAAQGRRGGGNNSSSSSGMPIENEIGSVTGIEIVTEMSPGVFDMTKATAGGKKDGERNVNAAGVPIPRGSISRPIMEITIMG